MSRPQKTIVIVLWTVAVSLMVVVLALKMLPADDRLSDASGTDAPGMAGHVIADPQDQELPVLYDAPAFALTNQDGGVTSNVQLRGHPWVADFIFTSCTTSCPMMSSRMSELQKQLPEEVKLVSFSVDPAHDTPAVLRDYARTYHAEPGRWIFLTGDEKTQESVVRGMKLVFLPAQGSNPLVHDERFVLVDGGGHIRGYYDAYDKSRLEQLGQDVARLSDGRDGGAGK